MLISLAEVAWITSPKADYIQWNAREYSQADISIKC